MKWLRQHKKTAALLAIVLAYLSYCVAYAVIVDQPKAPSTVAQTQVCSPDATKLLSYINGARSKLGSPALETDASLATAALNKSENMLSLRYYGHQIPGGEDAFKYLRDQGVRAAASEELDLNALTPEEDWASFSGSAAHHKSLMNPQYTRIGISSQCTDYTVETATGPDDNTALVGSKAKALTVIYLAAPEPAQPQQSNSIHCTTLYSSGISSMYCN